MEELMLSRIPKMLQEFKILNEKVMMILYREM